MNEEIREKVEELRERLIPIEVIFDPASAKEELTEIEKQMSSEDFWSDQERAQEVGRKRSRLESRIDSAEELETKLEEIDVFAELGEEGEDVSKDLKRVVDELDRRVEKIEFEMKLSGENDDRPAIISIHPGAGGTESQDWAEMLLRMYTRYCEQKEWETEMVEYQAGEEAGIKSCTFIARADYAYGYLKAERGVHRLVRISPYDAKKRRHTSFASVHVYPEVDDDIEIEINEKDLRIDTYRSSGAGGQHVNVTDSAVRITHLPTNTVVTCQNERSQLKNRATAMKLLKAKLYQLELEKRQEEQAKLEGEKLDIGFGSQIRSYVLHPYQMIKDLRTDHEVGDVQRILDGDLDGFIEAYLNEQAQRKSES
ncbi:MAG: peptide chain release factor 2 [Thermoanaerobaculia bacterium]|nr:peptide chain release factor 2 [Thermoanaerobaculia bacterium]